MSGAVCVQRGFRVSVPAGFGEACGLAAGVAPGPGLRRALEVLLEEVITGRLPNKKAELLAIATKYYAS